MSDDGDGFGSFEATNTVEDSGTELGEDFGDDFGEFEDFQTPAQEVPSTEPTSPSFSISPQVSESEPRRGLKVKDIISKDFSKTQSFLRDPGPEPEAVQHLSETSSVLWKWLTEDPPTYMPDWNSSQIHKSLSVRLGVPMNLDLNRTLPRSNLDQRRMALPSDEGDEIPRWRLLTTVSQDAVDIMSSDELNLHLSNLQGAFDGAQTLRQSLENQEMDLMGEQSVLEGMVESLLVYSQRTHRDQLMRTRSRRK